MAKSKNMPLNQQMTKSACNCGKTFIVFFISPAKFFAFENLLFREKALCYKIVKLMVAVAQLVRASGCGPEGRRFETVQPPHLINSKPQCLHGHWGLFFYHRRLAKCFCAIILFQRLTFRLRQASAQAVKLLRNEYENNSLHQAGSRHVSGRNRP